MPSTARGTFDVTILPQAQDEAPGSALGRMSLDKRFSGEIEGTSKGEMLTAVMEGGSAVYVAIERVTGTLGGRSGSFVLVHQGTATADGQTLTITVAPSSGTDELRGLSGSMTLDIDDTHRYALTYELGAEPQ
jgi:hypothetical protein